MKNIVALATGSIGDTAFDVLRHLGDRFKFLDYGGYRLEKLLSVCVSGPPSYVADAEGILSLAKNFSGEVLQN